MSKLIGLFLSASLLLLIASCGSDSTTDKQADQATTDQASAEKASTEKASAEKASTGKVAKAATYVTMPESTAIAVTLIDSIDTDVQLTGAEFRAKLARPIVVSGHTLFAEGAEAKGVLNKVVESGRLKTPAELNFSLTAVQDGSGRWVNVSTGMIMEKKASHTAKEVAMIGGGAIVGGIIGKVVDKKGSTEIGAVAGAAAGTGLAAATGKQDIFHAVGTEVVFYSSQSLQVAVK